MKRHLQTAALGATAGSLSAAFAALEDFGATWLWLSTGWDRLALLARLLGVLVPLGAFGGCAVALALAISHARLGRRAALPLTLAIAPWLGWISWLLLSGGKTSQLQARPAIAAALTTGLACGAYFAIRVAIRLVAWSRSASASKAAVIAVLLLAVQFALAKVNQHAYPNLYEYLHALLAGGGWSFGLVAFAIAGLALPAPGWALMRRAGVGLLCVAAVGLAGTLATLDTNQNVRVTLFDARGPTSHAVMRGLRPLLGGGVLSARARASVVRAQQDLARRRRSGTGTGLPVVTNAHLVLITVDALRADRVGSYGYRRPTSPEIDALAREAVRFERVYTPAPHSSYAVSSLMVSEYLHELADLGVPYPDVTLARALRDANYYTAAYFTLGIFHTEGERLSEYRRRAFDFDLHDHADVAAPELTALALETVDRIAQGGEPPTFLWVHYFDVHDPYEDSRFGTAPSDAYDGEVARADAGVGDLVRAIRARWTKPTVFIVTADHGEEFREHGGVYHGSSLYEEQVRVPLLLIAPGIAPRVVHAPVSLVDVAPTALALLGLELPASMRGEDLRALATGATPEAPPVFACVRQKRMVVDWPYKLISEPRYGLFELYNLETDPSERHNLADRDPATLDRMRGETYAWLDALRVPPGVDQQPHDAAGARALALHWGRLGDPRAVEPLCSLVNDAEAPHDARAEAAKHLGELRDPRATEALVRAMDAGDPIVAAEAAIALGRMQDAWARGRLRELVFAENPDVRARAALALGRLRDPEAVPGLAEGALILESSADREDAVRWLGRIGDRLALEPLLGLLADERVRHLVVIALGLLGDPRAYETLVHVLDWEHLAHVRDAVARALGQLGDPRAAPRLVQLAVEEPTHTWTTEALVRVDAIGQGLIGGEDARPGVSGFAACHEGPLRQDAEFLYRTWCESAGRRARMTLRVPPALARNGGALVVRVRRLDADDDANVAIELRSMRIGQLVARGAWAETRIPVTPAQLGPGPTADLTMDLQAENGRLGIDHALVIGDDLRN